MSSRIPYFRVLVAAIASAALLAVLLNLYLHDWIGSLNLATVTVFTFIALVLIVRALVEAIIDWIRRNRDDPFGNQKDFDLAA